MSRVAVTAKRSPHQTINYTSPAREVLNIGALDILTISPDPRILSPQHLSSRCHTIWYYYYGDLVPRATQWQLNQGQHLVNLQPPRELRLKALQT